ncbi:hypothetical protein CC2G_008536 [Coprinopsis cinerea AmutBmut pab1-1]|nr:hypothetical protein CC2G_008536 [Coprinopsis cinerea AmutBmut pab1-1]
MSTTASEPLVLPLPPLDKHCSYNPCPTFGESDGEAKHRCSLCKGVSYCGQRCQKLDWKENHRWNCSPLAIDNDKAFLEPDPEELEELTRVIMHWKEAYDKLPDAEKQKQNKGWKASSMPESKGLLGASGRRDPHSYALAHLRRLSRPPNCLRRLLLPPPKKPHKIPFQAPHHPHHPTLPVLHVPPPTPSSPGTHPRHALQDGQRDRRS